MANFSTKRVMSGTWGQVWLNGELVSECTAFQAKLTFNKSPVPMCGQMGQDSKVTSTNGTGSLTMNKINSRMVLTIGNLIQQGIDVRFSVIAKLDDPDAFGAERFVYNEVSFDDLTVADWSAGQPGTVTAPFTFVSYAPIDTVPI